MNYKKPAWWQLYLLGVVAAGLIILAHQWHASEMLRGTAKIAIVLTGYGVFQMWLSLNGPALERMEEAREARREGKAPAASDQQAYYRRVYRARQSCPDAPVRVHIELIRRDPR
jgi:hypothetical protein